MSKHTKGPWTVSKGANFIEVVPVTGSLLGIGQQPVDLRLSAHAEVMANARLIAAAPDLLDFLKRLTVSGEFEAVAPSWYQDAMELIKKAEGN